MTEWHRGPPPSIGWWPASVTRNPDVLRWWNGKRWSAPTFRNYPAKEAAKRARLRALETNWLIEWGDRPASWPERSKT